MGVQSASGNGRSVLNSLFVNKDKPERVPLQEDLFVAWCAERGAFASLMQFVDPRPVLRQPSLQRETLVTVKKLWRTLSKLPLARAPTK